ncbi:MAG: hypothetical protein J6L88_00690, partial [Clostridia bacterium]|nr:hypothetical protein [Clostridia bacterium]
MVNNTVTIALIPCVSQRADLKKAKVFFEQVKATVAPWGARLWDMEQETGHSCVTNQMQMQAVAESLHDVDGLFF